MTEEDWDKVDWHKEILEEMNRHHDIMMSTCCECGRKIGKDEKRCLVFGYIGPPTCVDCNKKGE